AFVLSMALVALFGMLVERTVFRPVRQSPLLTILLVSIGLSIFLQSAALLIVGPDMRRIPDPFGGRILEMLGLSLTAQRLLIFVTALILIGLLYCLFRFTKIGKAIRATAQERDGAALAGIPINRVYAVTFAIGTGLAAAAGCLVGPIFFIDPFMGFMPGLKSFIVVILGGMGSIPGAILGGLVLGMAEVYGGAYISSEYKDAIAFIILIVILVVKPTGFMGMELEER
ncbi:MAG: branched-chain amino acid ABC transporter permease, partial [Proteobacteria bacterium]|nr:branched-chain amino acid ABC transporter permease [Pseudomonadota bacterium]